MRVKQTNKHLPIQLQGRIQDFKLGGGGVPGAPPLDPPLKYIRKLPDGNGCQYPKKYLVNKNLGLLQTGSKMWLTAQISHAVNGECYHC